MPNNSSARREKKSKEKKKSEKRRTAPPPLHKEDKASMDKAGLDSVAHSLSLSGQDELTMDTSSSSLSLAGAEKETPLMMGYLEHYHSMAEEERVRIHEEALRANPKASAQELIEAKRVALWKSMHKAQKRKDHAAKDASSPPSLSAGTGEPISLLSLQAQPKLSTPTSVIKGTLSLTKEERAPVFEATKRLHPNADHKAFNEAYRIALWKADNQKRGIISGGSLGAVDISLSSETDDKGDSGEDSDSSEDGLQAIRNDLLRQGQVYPPSSPKANRLLARLMKSPPKLQLEERSRQDLDKEPLSFVSPTKQAKSDSAEANQGHKTGDVTGQGGSVSASLGLSSLVSLDNEHQLDRQTAADTIRNGSLLSLPQPTEATGINSIASS